MRHQTSRRPDPALVSKLSRIGSATVSSELSRLGIRSAHIRGPVSVTPGVRVAGPALTLQFMPTREDVYPVDEYGEPEEQLHRHVMYHTQPGDMIVVDARGDMSSGMFGEMMLTYFKGRGGAGVVVDGCLRDFGAAKQLGVGLWLRGATPNFHAQTDIFPYAVNVPVACGGTLVVPGDIIVADDDGAVVVPVKLAARPGGPRVGARRVGGVLPRAAGRGRRHASVLPAVGAGPRGVRAVAARAGRRGGRGRQVKIERLQPWLVKAPGTSWGEYLFLEVSTDEGITGWGEITTTTPSANRALAACSARSGTW